MFSLYSEICVSSAAGPLTPLFLLLMSLMEHGLHEQAQSFYVTKLIIIGNFWMKWMKMRIMKIMCGMHQLLFWILIQVIIIIIITINIIIFYFIFIIIIIIDNIGFTGLNWMSNF